MQGWKVIDSRTIRKQLRETYSKAHHQTVSRAMEFINEIGGEHVQLKQNAGRQKLVFEPDLIDPLESVEQLAVDDIDQVTTSGVMVIVRKG